MTPCPLLIYLIASFAVDTSGAATAHSKLTRAAGTAPPWPCPGHRTAQPAQSACCLPSAWHSLRPASWHVPLQLRNPAAAPSPGSGPAQPIASNRPLVGFLRCLTMSLQCRKEAAWRQFGKQGTLRPCSPLMISGSWLGLPGHPGLEISMGLPGWVDSTGRLRGAVPPTLAEMVHARFALSTASWNPSRASHKPGQVCEC